MNPGKNSKLFVALLLVLGLGQTCYGQDPVVDSIPNANFEVWNDIPNTFGGQDPENWTSTNKASAGSNRKGIARTTDAYDGKFALEISPLISADTTQSRTAATVLGIAKLNGGDFSIDYQNSGVPYKSNIPYLFGYYKFVTDSQFTDSAYAMVTTQVGNWGAGNGGVTFVPSNVFKPFRINILSGHFGKIDTLQIGFFYKSSSNSIEPKGRLIIDNLKGSFSNQVSVQSDDIKHECNVFPNPFNSTFSINLSGVKKWNIALTDIAGRVHYQSSTSDLIHIVDLRDLNSGLYILHLYNDEDRYTKIVMKQ